MKRAKKIFLIGLSGSLLGLPLLTPVANDLASSISKVDVENQAINTTEQQLSFTFKDASNISWAGTKFADEATNEDIKSILVPDKQYGANYFVKLLPINQDMLSQGYVQFVVKQVITDFTGGTNGGTNTKTVFIPPKDQNYSADISQTQETIDGEKVDAKNIWTTKTKLPNLFQQKKFSFKWNTDKEIGDFLKTTEKSTLNSDDIMNNFVSKSDSTDLLPSTTTGIFSQAKITSTTLGLEANNSSDEISENDAKMYGVGLVTVNFDGTNQKSNESDWVGNKIPTNNKRIVRGLKGTNGSKEEVSLSIQKSNAINTFKNVQLDLNKIKQSNPSFTFPMNATADGKAKISDFTPSQLINATDLTSLLTTTNYLPTVEAQADGITQTAPIYISYMGKSAFTDLSLPFKGTGLSLQTNVPYVDKDYNPILDSSGAQSTTGSQSVNNLLTITNVSANADDLNGRLELKIRYNYYDVYNNVMISNYEVPITITGMQKNADADKNLFFQWKDDNDLLYSSSADFLAAYEANKNNATYLKDLSNSLFFGSDDTYQKDRTFTVEKTSNGTGNQLTATITFPTFNGEWYEESGQKKQGKKFTKTFTFASSTASSVKFNTQDNVEAKVKQSAGVNWSDLTPEKLINEISAGKIDKNIFFANTYSETQATLSGDSRASNDVLFFSNSTNDGIIVQVASGSTYATTSFTGLKKGQSQNYIYNFSFSLDSTSDEGYQKLLAIPVEQITKKDVIDLYLSKLDIFKQGFDTITENDVVLVPNSADGSLEIQVTIAQFDSTNQNSNVNRVFKTTLQGLTSQTLIDNNSYIAPINLTVPLSAVFAGVITIALGTTLFLIVRKRMKLNKAKKDREAQNKK